MSGIRLRQSNSREGAETVIEKIYIRGYSKSEGPYLGSDLGFTIDAIVCKIADQLLNGEIGLRSSKTSFGDSIMGTFAIQFVIGVMFPCHSKTIRLCVR